MRLGYFLSCEEYSPEQLIEQAVAAEAAGFDALWISDHFHPWNDEQGQSPFVWSMIGALAQACSLPVTTAVTCPTVRTHPAIIAQAAATSARLLGGKFVLGVGTGEALNEHILGDPWPSEDVRLEMLEEAVELIRELWAGEVVTRQGRHYQVDTARIYTRPDQPPPIYMSAFGPKSLEVAGRIADGFICTQDDADMVSTFKEKSGGKPAQGGYKVGWADTETRASTTPTDSGRTPDCPVSWRRYCPRPTTSSRRRSWCPASRPPTASWRARRSSRTSSR
jgi:G6PDH family F420-dependent oxidoreductase